MTTLQTATLFLMFQPEQNKNLISSGIIIAIEQHFTYDDTYLQFSILHAALDFKALVLFLYTLKRPVHVGTVAGVVSLD